MTTVTFTTAGTFTWTAPAGVTSVLAECWGGGASGASSASAGGGGGGEYAAVASVAVTAGNAYSYTVGAGGASKTGSSVNGNNGSNSAFTGNSVTVTGHGGSAGTPSAGGGGGTGAGGTHHDGGAGARVSGGGGGGGSGGTSAAGITATTTTGASAVTDGGPGGNAGSAPASGPGGGGGGATSNNSPSGAGSAGQVRLTWTVVPTTVAGPAAGVTVAAPAGTVITTVTVTGPAADTAVAAPAGSVSGGSTVIAGPAANVAVAALAGTAGGAMVTVAGPVANVAANALAGTVIAVSGGPVSAPAERASLLIDSQIELLQGGVQSTIPACYGAVFMLDQGYDLGAPVPVIDIIGELVRDGEILIGDRASNRTLTVPIVIKVPSTGDLYADLATLAGARETLVSVTNKKRWTLMWTRDGGYPLVYDCSRAAAPSPKYSVRQDRQALASNITITFQAQPYGRSDLPEQLSFASPVSGSPPPPPSPVPLDDYEIVTGSHWSASGAHITGTTSAHWTAPAAQNAGPTYASVFQARDITGRGVLQFWAGFASSRYSYLWGSSPSPVAFTCTLYDSKARTLTFGASASVVQSSVITSPNWYQVSARIPSSAAFNYAAVIRCDITTTNFNGRDLDYTDVFLDDLTAQPSTTTAPASVRGSLVTLRTGGTSHAPLSLQFEQPPAALPTTFTLTGSGTFGPVPAGVTSISVQCTGGGGAGAGLTASGHGGGGGGGGFGQETSLDVTPGQSYSYQVGQGGTQGASPVNGGASTFAGDDTTVTGAGGHSAAQNSSAGGSGGAASSNAVAFPGGSGATPSATGGGGGAAASATGAGANGSGGAGGTGPSGDGGSGGASGNAAGSPGTTPGGGGGGANSTGGAAIGGAGAAGTIVVTYTVQQPPFRTLIAHRPGPDSPASLTPFVSVANVTDPPDGRQYPVVSRIAGINARFKGTYTIIGVANSFNSPASPRTAYVTVWQTDYPGGPSTPVSTIPRTFTPATQISNGIVTLGELTLPARDVPEDNTSMFHTLGITDSNLGDQWLDFLLCDTRGQLVIINTAVPQSVFYIDEATSDRDVGRVLGSSLDRTQAVSVLADTFLSGTGLSVEGGTDNLFLAYSPSGAPAIGASYRKRYFLDRIESGG